MINHREERNPMEYKKPEVNVVGDAIALIQSTGKGAFPYADFALPPPRPKDIFPAYDLDE
jgi:hypothetical protein